MCLSFSHRPGRFDGRRRADEKWRWDCLCWKDQTWCRYTMEHIPHPSRHFLSRWFVPFSGVVGYVYIVSWRGSDNSERFLFRTTLNMFGLETYGPSEWQLWSPGAPERSRHKNIIGMTKRNQEWLVYHGTNHRPPYIAWTPVFFWGCVNLRRNKIYHDTSADTWRSLDTSEDGRVSHSEWLSMGLGFFGGFIDAPGIFGNDRGFLYLVCSTRGFLVLKRFG